MDDQTSSDVPGPDGSEISSSGVPESSGRVGYLVTWTSPDGRTNSQWYSRLGNARNRVRRLGETGSGLDPRLFRTGRLTELPEEVDAVYDPSIAEVRRDWGATAWRQALLRQEPRMADWFRTHPGADRALGTVERWLTSQRRRRTEAKTPPVTCIGLRYD
jgi:hypothetical protein